MRYSIFVKLSVRMMTLLTIKEKSEEHIFWCQTTILVSSVDSLTFTTWWAIQLSQSDNSTPWQVVSETTCDSVPRLGSFIKIWSCSDQTDFDFMLKGITCHLKWGVSQGLGNFRTKVIAQFISSNLPFLMENIASTICDHTWTCTCICVYTV